MGFTAKPSQLAANNDELTAQTQDMRHCNNAAHDTLNKQDR